MQLGVSTRALQEYRYAASQAGIEQAEMDKALEQLTRRLGDAAQGVKEPLAALERLGVRSEEHTSELQSLMRISYPVFCLKKKTLYKSDAHANIPSLE